MNRARIRRGVCVTAAVLASLASSHARADILVLDACVEKCDADDLTVISRLRLALKADTGAVLARLGEGVPLPAIADPALTAAELTKRFKSGIDEWAGSSYEQAQAHLTSALADAAENPALVVLDPTLRQLIPRAIVGRAVSAARLKHEDQAKTAMMDLVRVTNEDSILDRWGPEANRIFQLARKDALARGRGSIVVDVDDPSAIFYVNENGEPHKSTFASEMIAGSVRVVVQDARGRARRYVVTIAPGAKTTLDVRWERDAQFEIVSARTSPQPRVGFTYRSASGRGSEQEYARHLGTRAGARDVAVIGRRQRDGKPMISATVYHVTTDAPPRSCIAPMLGNADDYSTEIATCISSPERSTPHVVRSAATVEATVKVVKPTRVGTGERAVGPLHAMGWGLGIGGVIGLGLTAYFQHAGTDEHTGRGFVIGGAGVAVGVVTTILYLSQSRRRAGSSIAVAPDRHGVFAAVSWGF